MNDNTSLVILDESLIKDLIYDIRGQKVMLDFDLARIYGYSTKALNQQVKNNLDKFANDFMFPLSQNEWDEILKSKILTSSLSKREESRDAILMSGKTVSSWGGRRKLPFAFTEQGIYMLMTVLRGELATKQSMTLIRLFKSMKDYLIQTNSLSSTNEVLALANQVRKNTEAIEDIKGQLDVVMDNFIDPSTYRSFLVMDGEKVESDVAYQRIYALAKQSVWVIDDYIDVKTIQLLKSCNSGIQITVFSDNKAKNSLTRSFVEDFLSDRPDLSIVFKITQGRFHDRYIVVDGLSDMRLFHCGASSKDGGNRIMTIMEAEIVETYRPLLDAMEGNEELVLP